LKAAGAGERNPREIVRPRDTDDGVGGNQPLFRLHDVGAPFQQRRGHTRWYVWQLRLIDERSTARHGAGIVAEQNADRVLLLLGLALEIDDGGGGVEDELLGLPNVEL